MKNFLLTLGLAMAAGALAFGAGFAFSGDPALRRAARDNDAMVWLRAEFHLSDAQYAAVKKLHDDYADVSHEIIVVNEAALSLTARLWLDTFALRWPWGDVAISPLTHKPIHRDSSNESIWSGDVLRGEREPRGQQVRYIGPDPSGERRFALTDIYKYEG